MKNKLSAFTTFFFAALIFVHNSSLLEALGLEELRAPVTANRKQKPAYGIERKRKASGVASENDSIEKLPAPKKARLAPSPADPGSRRRSARLESNGKTIDYRSDNFEHLPRESVKVVITQYV